MHEGERARSLFPLPSYAAAPRPPCGGGLGWGVAQPFPILPFGRKAAKLGVTPLPGPPPQGGGNARARGRHRNRPARSSPPRPSGEGDGARSLRHLRAERSATMSDTSIPSPLSAFSAAVADLVRGAAPSVVSVKSQRVEFERFRLAAGSRRRGGERARRRRGDRDRRPRRRLGPGRACRPRSVDRRRAPCASSARTCRKPRPRPPAPRRPARSRSSSPRGRALPPRRSGSSPMPARNGAACAAGSSTRGSSSARPCDDRARAGSRSTPKAAPSAWRCSARDGAPSSSLTATIDRVAATLVAKGRIARGYLGLGLQPVKLEGGGVGLMAISVDAKGPGAAAGVKQGDVIVAWNGEPLRGVHHLMRLLGPDSVGATVKLSLSGPASRSSST